MSEKEFHYHLRFDLKSSPEMLWPFLADTNRFNRDSGLPTIQSKSSARSANARKRLSLRKFGVAMEWDEQPFEWLKPSRFGVLRTYRSGPIASLRVLVVLNRSEDGGTNLSYEVWAKARNALGAALIPVQIGKIGARNIRNTILGYDRLLDGGTVPRYQLTEALLSQDSDARLTELASRLEGQDVDHSAVSRLVEMLRNADDLSLARMRPYELADYWNLPRRQILEEFLLATRIGILDLQWDVICPHCRGAGGHDNLSSLSATDFCETCNIDFEVDFERTVELTFRPNASIRKVQSQMFCVGGPEATPHVVAQQLISAGERRIFTVPLEIGRYRMRAMELAGSAWLQVTSTDGARRVQFILNEGGWPAEETLIDSNTTFEIENRTSAEQLLILERTAWGDGAVTAAEVTALQVFRDLFSTEALRQGERISVGGLTVLFTDLRGSTQLYREIGDAPAFGKVMNHFDILKQCIAEHDGALVKTIGDAVMAVFRRPASALRATLKAQKMLSQSGNGIEALHLKGGIHTGPSIAVTLNGRLDYFGGTINMASRLESLSSGSDVIVSSEVYADPEVRMMLTDASLEANEFEMKLKGFEDQDFTLWRIKEVAGEAPAATASARPYEALS